MSDSLYARNWAFIDASTQERLNSTTLFTAGTGLGSLIALLATRTGFGRFILADGDIVERSNLNRQAFTLRHLGHNKALATADLLAEIRTDLQVQTIPAFLTEDTLLAPIRASDIVINTIDFDDPVFLACNRIARAEGRTVLLPMNLGWGAALYVFAPKSPTLEEVFAAELQAGGPEAIKQELVVRALGQPHAYLDQPLADFLAGKWRTDAQLGPAAFQAAALTVAAAVALVRGETLRTFPDPAVLDAWAAATANGAKP